MATLIGDITSATSVLPLSEAIDVGSYPAPFTLESEAILVIGGDGSVSPSVTRGQNGTAAAAHASGTELVSGWGISSVPTLGEVLTEGNDPDDTDIVSADSGTNLGAYVRLQPGGTAPDTGGIATLRGGASNVTGGPAYLVGGNGGGGAGAEIVADGATNADQGVAYIKTKGSNGENGQVLTADADAALQWTGVLSSIAGVPDAPLTTLLVRDTTAVSGGLYAWNGTGYTKVANIVS